MANLNSLKPTRKVASGGLTGAVITVCCWILKDRWRIEVPGEVVAALTTVVGFAIAYLVPSAAEDLVAAPAIANEPSGVGSSS